jgi:dipeptidyl aminopeptidase/acylaminoacyl peptidase
MSGARRFTPEMAVSLQIADDVQPSPDGSRVAFVVAPIGHEETKRRSQIWLANVAEDSRARAFTGSAAENRSPRWSPDGARIAFLSDRQSRGAVQLHLIEADGGEARQIVNIDRGLESIAWAPDGQSIFATADRRALAGEQDSPSDVTVASRSARPRAIVRVDVRGASAVSVIGPAVGHVWDFAVRPDGRMIAALVTPTNFLEDTETVRLVLLDPVTRAEQQIASFRRQPSSLGWSPNGTRLVAVGETGHEPDDTAVLVIDAGSGELTRFDAGESTPIWAGWVDDATLVTAAKENLWARIDVVDIDAGTATRLDALPEGGSLTGSLSLSADGATLAAIRTEPLRPPEVWAGPRDGALQCLTRLNPQLDGVDLAPMESVQWQASDGLTIQGWLLTPPDAELGARLPLIVNIHGGPTAVWDAKFHATWHDWGQNLAAEGYAVLLPNPRGSTGRGRAFTSANRPDSEALGSTGLGSMDFDDVMRGVDAMVERGVADPDRLGVAGWSYGGYLTAWAIAHSDRFKAAVCGAAVTNWPSKVGTTDIRPMNEDRLGGPLHVAPDVAWQRSPIRYLGNITTPTLVVHGEADKRVPVSQGLELYAGLKAIGVPTDFVTYPRQEHAFQEKAHQLDVLKRIIDWFRTYL